MIFLLTPFSFSVASNIGYKSLFTTVGNRKRMRIILAIAFFSQWSGNGLVSYYLNKVFDTIGITDSTIQVCLLRNTTAQTGLMMYVQLQLLINGILSIWNLFWGISAALLVDRLGRRLLFLTSVGGMIIFFIMQTVCSAIFAQRQTEGAAHAVIAFIFLFYAAYE